MSADETSTLRWGYIKICNIYTDDDLIELQTQICIADWSAVGTCYTSATDLAIRADNLARWALDTSKEHILETGVETTGNWLKLRFHEIDMAGHLACCASLSTSYYDGFRANPWSVSVAVPTEPGFVQRFANDLRWLAQTPKSVAILEGVQR